ncbi:hypothetical protein RclHR1_01040020 [Rhizophagus clarus]|uniref:Uncharacterized protein n=1 Tax=Rhizophagus clarus TaxID=94130 RepID=A0A2Z6Q2H3_9GLOM|nr:hypothetical protein RclHR1_01040020 [Rhizophagus clarus]GET02668.1 hypothetical protein GLOIN_2v1761214 [Rhizophagus clarus]
MMLTCMIVINSPINKNFLAFQDDPSQKFFGNFQNIEQFLSYILKLLLLDMSVNKSNLSELELLRQHISELETKNAEILDFRRKISEFDAERAELKCRIAETLRSTEKTSKWHNAENAKLKA